MGSTMSSLKHLGKSLSKISMTYAGVSMKATVAFKALITPISP
jgi:hypothetical protein